MLGNFSYLVFACIACVLIWKNARARTHIHTRTRTEGIGASPKIIEMEETNKSPLLWEAIVSNDDVCFKHVLPKLNQTDLKFLYDVNSETRKLIKRARPFGIELKCAFKIAEMSSISTLEFAWKNRPLWPENWDGEKMFCYQVTRTNKLELLKWAREEKKCEWDTYTFNAAAEQGNLEMLKYCIANKCPVNELASERAASSGQLECLKYLHEVPKAPWDWRTSFGAASGAARNGHLHILEYLVERKYDNHNEYACRIAAVNGHLDCLKFLRETAKAPWGSSAVRLAHKYHQPECLQYLLDNDCPLPEGWRYEHGELYTPESESSTSSLSSSSSS